MATRTVGFPVRIIVGGEYDRDGTPIHEPESDRIRAAILTQAARTFGGVTLTDTHGAWVDKDGEMVEERGFQITVYVMDVAERKVGEFIRFVRIAGRQTSVLVDAGGIRGAFLSSGNPLHADATDDSPDIYGAEHA